MQSIAVQWVRTIPGHGMETVFGWFVIAEVSQGVE